MRCENCGSKLDYEENHLGNWKLTSGANGEEFYLCTDKCLVAYANFWLANITEGDEEETVPPQWLDDHGDPLTTDCELCSKRITGNEIGGFTESGPHCEECDNNLCKVCNGNGYHDYDREPDSQMCAWCQGSGLDKAEKGDE